MDKRWDEDLHNDTLNDENWTSSARFFNEQDTLKLAHRNSLNITQSQSQEPPWLEAPSGFDFTSSTHHNTRLNITKYIPVGCLLIQRDNVAITSEHWKECRTQWQALSHLTLDPANCHNARYLPMPFQNKLLDDPNMSFTRALHEAGWVRMEFRSCKGDWGHIRVYILPDDIARGEVYRDNYPLRKALTTLLNKLHLSREMWNASCPNRDHLNVNTSSFLVSNIESPSLFQLFNMLPSPKPQPEMVQDIYVQDAMNKILENKIDGVSTPLYSYQQQSAALMVQRESAPAQIIDPRLSTLVDHHNKSYYCDSSTGTILREPKYYEAARGGICAETMGLGKTLIAIAVILSTKEISSKIPDDVIEGLPIRRKTGTLLEMVASKIGQNGLPWRHWLKRQEADGYEYKTMRSALEKAPGNYMVNPPMPRRASRNPVTKNARKLLLSTSTIVVVPPNLVQQWLREIEKHTLEGSLNVLLMDDLKKNLPRAEELLDYDIILFSKPRFEYEARDEQTSMEGVHAVSSNNGSQYWSPLKDIHFKRLIVDEGHTFGNVSRSSKTEAVAVVDFLKLSARWIISGTPTKGLYGVEAVSEKSSESSFSPESSLTHSEIPQNGGKQSGKNSSNGDFQMKKLYALERKDVEKLGNIATSFLKLRPWANSLDDDDQAAWSQYVMQPRHGFKSRGNPDCLRRTLEGMIIRHRPEDVRKDISLPPLYHNFVYLEGSLQNKLSLNTFALMIITNAVTSERKDADYFFHSRQRKNLLQLVSNLRQGSFFWSGFVSDHIQSTIDNAKKFLEERKVPITPEDEAMLWEVIRIGDMVISNKISDIISKSHEMPMYVENKWNEDIRKAWSLDEGTATPTLMGATLVHNAQKFVEGQLYKSDPMEGLVEAGNKNTAAAFAEQNPGPRPDSLPTRNSKSLKRHRSSQSAPELAGGVAIGDGSSPRKKSRASASAARKSSVSSDLLVDVSPSASTAVESTPLTKIHSVDRTDNTSIESVVKPAPKSALKKATKPTTSGTLNPDSPLASSAIISTASVKLSYLIDKISTHHNTEKILVFYESDNVAYYIAQALECLGIKHLIYAKSLHTSRRAKYVVTFNTTETFRVLLMDVSQAAFGLDLSSASRVWFVNPVFDPQVEAQAVKRAHRIGQTKPVYVETLVLRDSIEEVILERRKDMSENEHQKCKSILDDQTLYDWIKNVGFIDIPNYVPPGPEQMAVLERPQLLFKSGVIVGHGDNPDADLVGSETVKGEGKGKGKAKDADKTPKKRAKVAFFEPMEEEVDDSGGAREA